jgi:hypothetical protein
MSTPLHEKRRQSNPCHLKPAYAVPKNGRHPAACRWPVVKWRRDSAAIRRQKTGKRRRGHRSAMSLPMAVRKDHRSAMSLPMAVRKDHRSAMSLPMAVRKDHRSAMSLPMAVRKDHRSAMSLPMAVRKDHRSAMSLPLADVQTVQYLESMCPIAGRAGRLSLVSFDGRQIYFLKTGFFSFLPQIRIIAFHRTVVLFQGDGILPQGKFVLFHCNSVLVQGKSFCRITRLFCLITRVFCSNAKVFRVKGNLSCSIAPLSCCKAVVFCRKTEMLWFK